MKKIHNKEGFTKKDLKYIEESRTVIQGYIYDIRENKNNSILSKKFNY